MDVRIEIMQKGYQYTTSCEIVVCEEDRGVLERILLENGLSYKVTIVEDENKDDENW